MNEPTTKVGMMTIVGYEPCSRCDGIGHIVNRGCRYQCGICGGTGDQPIYEDADNVTITFDDPNKGVTA